MDSEEAESFLRTKAEIENFLLFVGAKHIK